MKLLVFMPDAGGCGFYRMKQPAAWLARMDKVEVRYFGPEHWRSINAESCSPRSMDSS